MLTDWQMRLTTLYINFDCLYVLLGSKSIGELHEMDHILLENFALLVIGVYAHVRACRIHAGLRAP